MNKYILMLRNPIYKIESHHLHCVGEAKAFIKYGSVRKSMHKCNTFQKAFKSNLNNQQIVNNTLHKLSLLDISDALPNLNETESVQNGCLPICELWLAQFIERTKYYTNIKRLCNNAGISRDN